MTRAASPPADTVYVVAPIVIEAPRTDARAELFGRSGFVAMVDMQPRRERVEDLSNVLSQLVGVRVKQYGGLGSFATASIRGSSSSQVGIFLDGIPISDPYLGVTNLSDLPLGGVSRVEVYRGFSPSDLGGSAIGGAINLVTDNEGVWTSRAMVPRVEFHSSGGSFDTRRQNGSLWLQKGALRAYAHGNYTESAGDFTFYDDNGTPANSDDDGTTRRVNNDFTAWNALAKLEAVSQRYGTVTLSHDRMNREQGVPGIGSFQSTTARTDRSRELSYVRYDGPFFLGKQLKPQANAFYSRTNERFTDPGGDISLVRQDTDNTIRVYGGRGRLRWLVPALPLAIDATIEARNEEFHPIDHVPTTVEGPDPWRRALSGATTAELYLLRETLVVSGTQRWHRNESEYFDEPRFPWLPPNPQGRVSNDTRSPSLGVRWQVQPWIALKGNVGRYYRLPTFLEMFGNAGSVTGNSALQPERGVNSDVGAVMTATYIGAVDNALIEVSYLDNDVDDLIVFFPNSQYTSKPTNIGAARIYGWELNTTAGFVGRYRLGANYARLNTEDTGPIPYYSGNALPSRPRDEFSASLAARVWHATATYEYHYIGANYLDRANLQEAPARNLHNLIVRIATPGAGISFSIEGRNLTNNQVSDVNGFPLPGRAVYSTLSIQHQSPGGIQ